VVFGLAGAVVVDSVIHLSGPPLLGFGVPSVDHLALKAIYFGFAAIGALAPDIDNARSTIGQRAGIVSKGIQHFAGHRRLFHSIAGLVLVGVFVWLTQYALGLALYRLGLHNTGASLGAGLRPGFDFASGPGVAFAAFLTGYFLHLVADSLTLGGVPWLWPSHARFRLPARPQHALSLRQPDGAGGSGRRRRAGDRRHLYRSPVVLTGGALVSAARSPGAPTGRGKTRLDA
jgi:inner membrane protein